MSRHVLSFLMILGSLSLLRAEQVLVTGASGEVLFGPDGGQPTVQVRAGQHLGAGTFSAGSNGLLYLSTFEGSELRLSESGTLHYDATNEVCHMEKGHGARSTFRLIKGKLVVKIKVPTTPPHCYHVLVPRAQASMAQGQCVMCMHGSDTFLYVAQGSLAVSGERADHPDRNPLGNDLAPIYGAVPIVEKNVPAPVATDQGEILIGNGKVGTVGVNGEIRVQPLSSVAAGTQTCLLAGFNAGADGGGKKPGLSPDASVVSPTQ